MAVDKKNINPYYEKKIHCPACGEDFNITKTRSSFVRLVKKDSDFCPHFQSVNPILYEAWICEHCGYAAYYDRFDNIRPREKKLVQDIITPKWKSRSFLGKRDFEKALEAFKIILFNLQVRKAPASEFGKICLRIAWIHRYIKDTEQEKVYLTAALGYYENTYTSERFPVNNLDEYSCVYIVGELARRLGDFEKAMTWFGKILAASANPEEKPKIDSQLLETTRDMIQLLKDARKKVAKS